MGSCHAVGVKEYGSKKVTVFEQTGDEEGLVASIILRSSVSNENMTRHSHRAVFLCAFLGVDLCIVCTTPSTISLPPSFFFFLSHFPVFLLL
jgi:hypothetical protein